MTRTGIFPKSHLRHLRSKQRGVAAIAMALVSVGVAGAGMLGFMLTRAQDTQSQTLGQAQVLAWADEAVRGFALVKGRMPCPAAAQNGVEVCSGAVKGWLPVATLMQTPTVIDPRVTTDALAGMRIRYMVSQGASGANSPTDMSALTAAFLPTLENAEPPSDYPGYIPSPPATPSAKPAIRGTLDLCAKLLMLRGGYQPYIRSTVVDGRTVEQVLPRRWRIAADPTVSAQERIEPVGASQVAYGVAVAAFGASNATSGSNANFSVAQMESPLRAKSATYQDAVRVVRPAELYDDLGCAGAIASLDTIAVADAWSGVNEGNRKGVIKFANRVIEITELALAADTVGAAIQAAELANGLWNKGGNIFQLAKAQANFLVEWPFIPVHVGGIAQAVAGGVLTAIDVGISAGAIAMDVIYRDGYMQARNRLEAFTVWTGGRGMLEQAQELGISTTLVPNQITSSAQTPEVPPDIGAPK